MAEQGAKQTEKPSAFRKSTNVTKVIRSEKPGTEHSYSEIPELSQAAVIVALFQVAVGLILAKIGC